MKLAWEINGKRYSYRSEMSADGHQLHAVFIDGERKSAWSTDRHETILKLIDLIESAVCK